MSVPATRDGEIRALTVFDAIPAKCRAMPVRDDWNAPHLRHGEVAILDPTDWLRMEHRMLSHELAGYDADTAQPIEHAFMCGTPGEAYHFDWPNQGHRLAGWPDAPQPSTRAAVVLSAVGCPLAGGQAHA